MRFVAKSAERLKAGKPGLSSATRRREMPARNDLDAMLVSVQRGWTLGAATELLGALAELRMECVDSGLWSRVKSRISGEITEQVADDSANDFAHSSQAASKPPVSDQLLALLNQGTVGDFMIKEG